MFERFTAAARETVVQAQVRARELGHGSIGPEHLLLGVLADTAGPAARALAAEGLDEATVHERVVARDRARGQAAHEADAEALRAIGIDLDAVRDQVETTFGPSALQEDSPRRGGLVQRLKGSHLAFEPAAKQTLVLALREAVALRSGRVGTEHLLLGLLRLEGGPVEPLLGDGATARVRGRVLAALSPVT